jgi:hypothetical protein
MDMDDELKRAAEKMRRDIEKRFAFFPEIRDSNLEILEIAVASMREGIERRFHHALTGCNTKPGLSRTTGRVCRRRNRGSHPECKL